MDTRRGHVMSSQAMTKHALFSAGSPTGRGIWVSIFAGSKRSWRDLLRACRGSKELERIGWTSMITLREPGFPERI